MTQMRFLGVVAAGLASSAMATSAFAQPAGQQPAGQHPAPYSAPPADSADSADALEPDDPAASSQPAPEAPPPSPESARLPPPSEEELVAPSRPVAQFLSLDRLDGVSRYVIDLAYTNFDTGNDGTLIPVRLGLHGQYLTPSGLGGFGSVSFSLLRGEDDSSTALGNLEAGAVYATQLGATDVVGRASLVLPTASDGEIGDILSNAINAFSRINDLVLFTPNITWLRVSGSPIWRRDTLLVRADIGADVPLNNEGDYQFTPALHANLGVAYLVDRHQIGVELVNAVLIDTDAQSEDGDSETSTESFHSLGASYRHELGDLALFAGLSKIFSSDDFDNLRFTLTGGVSGVFGN